MKRLSVLIALSLGCFLAVGSAHAATEQQNKMKIPDSLKKVISSKVLKKAEAGDSKVSGLKDLDNVSKNLSFLPNIARDLNIARQNIFKLVLHV
jgi:hypothetical protein